MTDGGLGGIGGNLGFKMPTYTPLVVEWIKAVMEITWSSPRDMAIKKVELGFKSSFLFWLEQRWGGDEQMISEQGLIFAFPPLFCRPNGLIYQKFRDQFLAFSIFQSECLLLGFRGGGLVWLSPMESVL